MIDYGRFDPGAMPDPDPGAQPAGTLLPPLPAALTADGIAAWLRSVAATIPTDADALTRHKVQEEARRLLTECGVPRAAQWIKGAFQVPRGRGADVAGAAAGFEVLEPWGEPVPGGDLIVEITHIIRRHVILPEHAPIAVALWAMHTYVFAAFDHTPRLALISPERRCGKTQLLILLRALVQRPQPADNITAAAMFRVVERDKPTLLVDEADSFLPGNEDLRGVLNSGHARGGGVTRCVGDNHEPRSFPTFCPVAIALIGKLPATLEDRSVVLQMRRKAKGEQCSRVRAAKMPALLLDVRRKLLRWAADASEELRHADPIMPAGLDDRAQDNWRPLLAIADAAGVDLGETARSAAVGLSARRDAEDGSSGVQLLADIQAMFERQGTDRLTSGAMVNALNAMEERPWPDWRHGKGMSQRSLAALLAPFQVYPGTVRIESETAKGYRLDAFQDAFARYLPPLGSDTASQARETVNETAVRDPSQSGLVTDAEGEGRAGNAGDVTV